MYIKPRIVTLTKAEIQKHIFAKASCATGSGYCSSGATYCGLKSSYSEICDASVIYCSGGNYTGTQHISPQF